MVHTHALLGITNHEHNCWQISSHSKSNLMQRLFAELFQCACNAMCSTLILPISTLLWIEWRLRCITTVYRMPWQRRIASFSKSSLNTVLYVTMHGSYSGSSCPGIGSQLDMKSMTYPHVSSHLQCTTSPELANSSSWAYVQPLTSLIG